MYDTEISITIIIKKYIDIFTENEMFKRRMIIILLDCLIIAPYTRENNI